MKFTNIKGNLVRYLKYLDMSDFFSFYVMLFCVIGIGAFGILPLANLSIQKIKLINEMKKTIISLDEKNASLQKYFEEYAQLTSYIPYLDAYMPVNMNLEDYIVSLNTVVGSKGFFLKNVSPDKEANGTTQEINVAVEGYGEMKELLKGIEELKRITQITMVNINDVKGRLILSMNLKIYSR